MWAGTKDPMQLTERTAALPGASSPAGEMLPRQQALAKSQIHLRKGQHKPLSQAGGTVACVGCAVVGGARWYGLSKLGDPAASVDPL